MTGRRGVGKSVVVALLQKGAEGAVDVVETGGVDLPLEPDPTLDGDVVVYVMAGVPTDADVAAVRRAEHVVTVLTKIDTVDDPAASLTRATGALGAQVLPLMATIALGTPVDYGDLRSLASAPIDRSLLLEADMFFAADLPVSVEARRRLVDAVELWGVREIVDTLHRSPTATDAELGSMLRRSSGQIEFLAQVNRVLLTAGAHRDLDMYDALRDLAVQNASARDAVEHHLSGDDAVLAEMAASIALLGSPEPTGTAVQEAAAWRDRAEHEPNPDARRAAIAVMRGYLRMATT